MILSRSILKDINSDLVSIPGEALFNLPERVLQFGTGVLLRGLPDYFIHKANQSGVFNGRVVVVKSTGQGDASEFSRQDSLYTLCVRGVMNNEKVEENIVNASISRVLSAGDEWQQVLACAHNQQMQIVVSNTTEVGIQLVSDDDIHLHPPKSFPGKLLAFLYERFKAFGGSEQSGMVVVATELIPGNGQKLAAIVLELARLNNLDEGFVTWIKDHNFFCNSLVDRIVPGKPAADVQSSLQNQLGYSDGLLIISEVYRLWAIEGGEQVRKALSFASVDEGVVIAPDITMYRELKLRLLNGVHTLSCGLSFLSGCVSVKEAMDDDLVSSYIAGLMNEMIPSIPYQVRLPAARDFGNKVLDRFRNPHIRHLWISITMQYSSKIKVRCVPALLKYYRNNGTVPELLTLGFAAYLYFMRPVKNEEGKYYGEMNGESYLIQDDRAEVFYKKWAGLPSDMLVKEVLRDSYWEENLHELPGFEEAVIAKFNAIMTGGMRKAIKESLSEALKKAPGKIQNAE